MPDRTILALGGELKSRFCLLAHGQAMHGGPGGDLAEVRHFDVLATAVEALLLQHRPDAIGVDLHPEYLSRKYGAELARRFGVPLLGVQHHHAHIASVLGEHAIDAAEPVLGIALDGLGYGVDGTLWGGELLLCRQGAFERLGALAPVAMPGGEMAARQPWRNALAHLHAVFGAGWRRELHGCRFAQELEAFPTGAVESLLAHNVRSPAASSCGRLFDAVAALLGLHARQVAFEGEAAMALEALATEAEAGQGYPLSCERAGELWRLGYRPMWQALLADLRDGVALPIIAARFHLGLASALAGLTLRLCDERQVRRVALSGGCLQNRLLSNKLQAELSAKHLQVLLPVALPAHDGGLAFGQAQVAAARLDSL